MLPLMVSFTPLLPPAKANPAGVGAAPSIELVREGCGWVGIAAGGGTVGAIGIGAAAIRIGEFAAKVRPCT
jgi:hypothetical protein